MCTICALTIEFAVEHPQTLAVAVATREAIDNGLLREGSPDAMDMTKSRHQAVVLLTVVQQRLDQVLPTSRLLALPDFYVLMIESRTWGYFHPTLGGFDTRANPSPPRVDPDENGDRDCVLVISQAAALSITKGKLPFHEAVNAGMTFIDAPDQLECVIGEALAMAYPASRFSEYVCTEVA
jgi:hypothetical protein